jgi:branched-chain amino acid transport system substrate-binding protein
MPHPRSRAPLAPFLVTILLPLLASCSLPGGATEDEVVFGLVAPLSRPYGELSRMGAELAVKEVNARWRGRRIRLELRDDQTSSEVAPTVAEELYADRRVVAVVGHANSGPMISAAPIYGRGLPALGTTATSPRISGLGPWIFRIASSDSANAAMLAREARRSASRIAILYSNEDYGRGLAQVFRSALKDAGTEIAFMAPYLEKMPDFGPYIGIMEARGVDMVLVAGLEDGAATMVRQAQAQGFRARVMGGDGLEVLVDMGPEFDGVLVGMLFHPEASDVSRHFAGAFRAEYGREPGSSAATSYDAVLLLARAVEEGHRSRRAIRRYLEAVGRPGGSPALIGAAGPVAFDPNGDPLEKPFVIGEIRDGAFVLYAAGG